MSALSQIFFLSDEKKLVLLLLNDLMLFTLPFSFTSKYVRENPNVNSE